LIGRADIVEVAEGSMRPVEYKVGGKVHGKHAAFQAAAQALCLEEMFDTVVEEVVVYFVKTRERVTYRMDDFRFGTISLINAIRLMKLQEDLPPPLNDKRCPKCSLIDACQPGAVMSAHFEAYNRLFKPFPMRELP
jgi:CRISPR-associated exonuclease Cas4